MGGGGSKSQTIGYRYYMGMHLVVCLSCDEVAGIYADELAIPGSSESTGENVTKVIYAPNLFGGDERGGGIVGGLSYEYGGATQYPNGYLKRKHGITKTPAYRGVFAVVLRKMLLTSMSPFIRPWSFSLKRYPGKDWYESTSVIEDAANGAHIIRETLLDTKWGVGLSDTFIDDDSFIAAADTLYAENMGLNFIFTRQTSAESFIQIVLSHINGVLYVDRSSGKFKLKLIRNDYDPDTIPNFTESDGVIRLGSFSRAAYGEMINSITVKYTPTDGVTEDAVTVQNLASIQKQNGKVINQTNSYTGLHSRTNAVAVATRDLKVSSQPLTRIQVTLNRKGSILNNGDVFRLSWEPLGILSMIVRVTSIDFGNLQNSEIKVTAIEDVFAFADTEVLPTQDEEWVDPIVEPTDPDWAELIEAPYFEINKEASPGDFSVITPVSSFVMGLVQRPDIPTAGYRMYTRLLTGTDEDYQLVDNGAAYTPVAFLDADIVKVQTSISFDLLTYVDLEYVEVGEMVFIDDEVCRLDSLDLELGTMVIARGCLDTVPEEHSAGVRVWFPDSGAGRDLTEWSAEYIKMKPVVFTAIGEMETVAANRQPQVLGDYRFLRPYPPGNFQVNGLYLPEFFPGDEDINLTWAHRDRTEQVVSLNEYSTGDIGPEPGVVYTPVLYDEVNAQMTFQSYDADNFFTQLLSYDFASRYEVIPNPEGIIIPNPLGTRTIKSIRVSIADNHGNVSNIACRRMRLYHRSGLIPYSDDWVCDATSYKYDMYFPRYTPEKLWNNALSDTGSYSGQVSWVSSSISPQSCVVTFPDPIDIDAFEYCNHHHGGTLTDMGANNVIIEVHATDSFDTTYGSILAGSEEVFNGVFLEHSAVDEPDYQNPDSSWPETDVGTVMHRAQERYRARVTSHRDTPYVDSRQNLDHEFFRAGWGYSYGNKYGGME